MLFNAVVINVPISTFFQNCAYNAIGPFGEGIDATLQANNLFHVSITAGITLNKNRFCPYIVCVVQTCCKNVQIKFGICHFWHSLPLRRQLFCPPNNYNNIKFLTRKYETSTKYIRFLTTNSENTSTINLW